MATAIADNKGPSQALIDSVNGTSAAKKSVAAEQQDRFMKLLVTQMKNQDPLNPLDNAQVTSQLAQLSTVTGIDKTNEALATLNATFQSNQNLQATSMIGHAVMVPGESTSLAGGKAMLGVDVTEPADSVTINVLDRGGNVVRTLDLGSQDIGLVPVLWDGKTNKGADSAPGAYTFSVTATRAAAPSKASPMAVAEVSSVSTSSTGVKLNLVGQAAVTMAQVRQIL